MSTARKKDDEEKPKLLFQNTIVSELKPGIELLEYDPVEVLNDSELTTKIFIKYSDAGEDDKLEAVMMELLRLNPPMVVRNKNQVYRKKEPVKVKITKDAFEQIKKANDFEMEFELAKRLLYIQKYGYYGEEKKGYKDLSHGLIQIFLNDLRTLYVGKFVDEKYYSIIIFLLGRKKTREQDINYILDRFKFQF